MLKLKQFKIGLRTIKTSAAVGLSMFLVDLLDLESPLFAGIGAISSMQSAVSKSFIEGKTRMLGTFVGATLGFIISTLLPQNYFFLSLGIIIIIVINNLFGWKKSLQLSCYVYLSIFLSDVDERIPYATYRLLSTFVGIVVGTIINYFIAAPDVKQKFIKSKAHIYETSKELVYNLVSKEKEIELEELTKELNSLENNFNLYKQELDYHITKSKISEASINILGMIDEIYNALHTLIRLQMKPILNKENAELYKKIYNLDYQPSARENNELDIVYNYHLNRILHNLINIENLLNT